MKARMKPAVFGVSVVFSFCSISTNMDLHARGYDMLLCDFNEDHSVSVADAVYLMRFITEDDTLILSDRLQNADLDADGAITILDVQALLREYTVPPNPSEPEKTPAETTTVFTAQSAANGSSETSATVINTDYMLHLKTLPAYDQKPYVTVNQNIPYYQIDSTNTTAYEYYSPLDGLGRCGVCDSCIGKELMPTEERGSIGMVQPSGWHTVRYDGIVDGNYLYNRCHLIGYQLTGENANVSNLITGTRYLNVTGMLPFENQTADYIKSTGNHVRYRVTPYFENQNLVADGVLMEACSVEDHGKGLQFNVFCYNVQPQIFIDYATGDSHLIESDEPKETEKKQYNYILNTNSKKFHTADCPSVSDISEKNKQTYKGSRDDLIAQGYTPCKRCNP